MYALAVIGNPIAQSRSPEIHALFAAQCQLEVRYERVLAPLNAFAETVSQLQQNGFRGANVTLPFKVEAFVLAQQHSTAARLAQAANTLIFDANIIADNTDGIGLVRDIEQNLAIPIQGKRVLILGAGGAAAGAIGPLLQQQPAALTVTNRTLSRAQSLAQHFEISAISYADLANSTNFDLIINATSASLSGKDLALPAALFAQSQLVYDMMYGKTLTPFLQQAQQQGAACVADGLGMLVEQAAESFFLWFDQRPETRPVIPAVRQQMQYN